MALNLVKGGSTFNLTKHTPTLKKVIVGMGWDPQVVPGGPDFDLDADAFQLGANGLTRDDRVICYAIDAEADGRRYSGDRSVVHSGDNRTGGGEGDDEQIVVDLEKQPADVQAIAFAVTIYAYRKRKQNFGQVNNAFIRIVNADTNEEICRSNLTDDATTDSAVVFGNIARASGGGWEFKAEHKPISGGLKGVLANYGINIPSDENDDPTVK